MKIKRQLPWWAAFTVWSMFAFNPAFAQPNATQTSTKMAPLTQATRADKIAGHEVITSDNQKLGKLDVLVADLESGHVLYAVVETSKGKVAIPPEVFSQATGQTLRLSVPKDQVESAPQFTSDVAKSGAMDTADYVNKVCQHFSLPAWWQGAQGATAGSFHNVHRVGQMTGLKVENSQGQPFGKVNEVVVDLPAGHVLYVILSPEPSLKLGDNLYPVPPQVLTLSQDQKHQVTGLDQQKLAGAPHFAKNAWPNLSSPSLAAQIYQYYGKQPYFNAGGTLQPTGRTYSP